MVLVSLSSSFVGALQRTVRYGSCKNGIRSPLWLSWIKSIPVDVKQFGRIGTRFVRSIILVFSSFLLENAFHNTSVVGIRMCESCCHDMSRIGVYG